MALWKLSGDCGEEHYLELQDEKGSAEIAGLQLINEIRDAVSRRISLAFDNSIILDIAQKTIEEIYDTLKEEQRQLINIGLALRNFEILDIAQKTIEEIDDKLKEEQPIYEKVERVYKDFIMGKGQPIIISPKELMRIREKIRGMINIDKFKEECMQDPVLECYDGKELSIKIFDIFKELKDSGLIYDARLLDDEYYDLIGKKEKEIIKNHKDLYKHRGVSIDQYVKWRKEFKDRADKVFETYHSLIINPIHTREDAVDLATDVWMLELFGEGFDQKNEKELERIMLLDGESGEIKRFGEIEQQESLKNITQEMKNKVKEGIKKYYANHFGGCLSSTHYEFNKILLDAGIAGKYIRKISPTEKGVLIDTRDFSVCLK